MEGSTEDGSVLVRTTSTFGRGHQLMQRTSSSQAVPVSADNIALNPQQRVQSQPLPNGHCAAASSSQCMPGRVQLLDDCSDHSYHDAASCIRHYDSCSSPTERSDCFYDVLSDDTGIVRLEVGGGPLEKVPTPGPVSNICGCQSTCRKGRLVSEKRRRRAAEQSLMEVQHQRDRLARRVASLQQAAITAQPLVAESAPSGPDNADICTDANISAAAEHNSGTLDGAQGADAAAAELVGTPERRRGSCWLGLAQYAGQDLEAPALSAFTLSPPCTVAPPRTSCSNDGSLTHWAAATPLALAQASSPTLLIPRTPSPPGSRRSPTRTAAAQQHDYSFGAAYLQDVSDQVVVARMVAGIMTRVAMQDSLPAPPTAPPPQLSPVDMELHALSRQLADAAGSAERARQEATALRLQLQETMSQQQRQRRVQQALVGVACAALAAAATLTYMRMTRRST